MKNIQKTLLFLVIFILQSTSVLAFYSDVPETHKYYKSIKSLQEQKQLPDTTNFQPDKILTETDFYELLFTYANANLPDEANLPFTNTTNTDKYAKYLQKAIDLNLLIPRSKTLNFNTTVTKQQALKTTLKTLGIGTSYFFHEPTFPFKDVRITSNTAPLAVKAAEIGIFEEINPKLFKGSSRITKGKYADYLNKIRQYSPSSQNVEITFLQNNTYNQTQQKLINNQSFDTLLDVWSKIKDDYYYQDEVNDQDLITGAIKGLVSQIDDVYTVYNTPDEAKAFYQVLSSEYEGIGMSVELIDGNITIISPFRGSPAEKGGLKPADIITKIDNENVIGKSLEYVVSKIKGKAGTKVKITIKRGDSTQTFNITRELVSRKSVQHSIKETNNKKIGYIELSSFGDTTYSDFLKAADDLLSQKVDGLIIDLRNNPGGYMDTAIKIISLFTKENKTAVELKFSNGNSQKYQTNGDGRLEGLKTVIIQNKGSASASEILSGALRDYKVATIVGSKSFGKGSVQQLATYKDGSLFKYTISKWFTPNGLTIDHTGMDPDITIENSENSNGYDAQLEKALKQF